MSFTYIYKSDTYEIFLKELKKIFKSDINRFGKIINNILTLYCYQGVVTNIQLDISITNPFEFEDKFVKNNSIENTDFIPFF